MRESAVCVKKYPVSYFFTQIRHICSSKNTSKFIKKLSFFIFSFVHHTALSREGPETTKIVGRSEFTIFPVVKRMACEGTQETEDSFHQICSNWKKITRKLPENHQLSTIARNPPELHQKWLMMVEFQKGLVESQEMVTFKCEWLHVRKSLIQLFGPVVTLLAIFQWIVFPGGFLTQFKTKNSWKFWISVHPKKWKIHSFRACTLSWKMVNLLCPWGLVRKLDTHTHTVSEGQVKTDVNFFKPSPVMVFCMHRFQTLVETWLELGTPIASQFPSTCKSSASANSESMKIWLVIHHFLDPVETFSCSGSNLLKNSASSSKCLKMITRSKQSDRWEHQKRRPGDRKQDSPSNAIAVLRNRTKLSTSKGGSEPRHLLWALPFWESTQQKKLIVESLEPQQKLAWTKCLH